MQNKSKSELCEQDNQIAEEYWDELCDAVGKVCANPSDDNFQMMEGVKNKITKFYQAHNKKMEAFDDFEDVENDSEIIDQLKLKVTQKDIEKELKKNIGKVLVLDVIKNNTDKKKKISVKAGETLNEENIKIIEDIISMLEDNIDFNKALVFSNMDEHGLIEKHIQADEKRLDLLKDFMEEGTKKHFIEPEIPPFEPYIKS